MATYERLFGAEVEHRETVPDQGVEAASLRIGDGRVELLASLGDETPVGKFLAKRGPGMHHVAYEVAVLAAFVPAESADELERALGGGGDGSFALEAEDGRYTVSLRRVVYVKRFTREARVGFTPA